MASLIQITNAVKSYGDQVLLDGAEDTIEYVLYGAAGELPSLPTLRASVGAALVEVSSSEIADDWATRWRVLRETQMRPVLVVVAHILRHQPLQMPLIQDDHVVQQVSSAAPHPTLSNPVLPRAAKGSACWVASHFLHRRHHIATKF